MIKSARVRVFVGLVIGIAAVTTLVAVLQKRSGHYSSDSRLPATPSQPGSPAIAENPEPGTTPQGELPTPPASESPIDPNSAVPPISYVGTLHLVVPVAGVRPDQLRDTFADSRSEGRVHDAIDIPAAQGTPVVAAAEGEVLKLFQSERGGTTIYQWSADKKLVFYYGHLQRYADQLFEGKLVGQGEVIGYVGDTGNAGPGNYHLHFSISVVADPKRYWEGVNINPYPLLHKRK